MLAEVALVLLPNFLGFIASRVTRKNVPWANTLNKPPLNPPNWVFPVVWPTLYLLMGIASYRINDAATFVPTGYLVDKQFARVSAASTALVLYFVQLAVNFSWSYCYFYFHSLLAAMLDAWLLTVLVAVTMRQFFAIDSVAGWLFVPYLAWSLYASYLATGIYLLNGSSSSGEAKDGTSVKR